MAKSKKKCVFCGLMFIPDKYNPDQECCHSPECRRRRESRRQSRHYRNHCADPAWRDELSGRKKSERARRRSAARPPGSGVPGSAPPDSSASCSATHVPASASPPVSGAGGSDYGLVLDGLLVFMSGAKDASELFRARERCVSMGRDLSRDRRTEEDFPKISSRPFEAEAECSSRPLRV